MYEAIEKRRGTKRYFPTWKHTSWLTTQSFGRFTWIMLTVYTVFLHIHAHARIRMHSSQNSSSTWSFLHDLYILQLVSGAKCGSNIDISKPCMLNSGHVSLLYRWVTGGGGLFNVSSTPKRFMTIGLNHGDCLGVVHVQCACKRTNTVHNSGEQSHNS